MEVPITALDHIIQPFQDFINRCSSVSILVVEREITDESSEMFISLHIVVVVPFGLC